MDRKLLDALNNLSYALEEIADSLKDKGGKGNKSATTTALQGGKLDKQLQSIDKGVKQLQSDNKKILKNQETLIALSKKGPDKKGPAEKETPLDKASDPKQKSKLKDGLASIMMIAVGVLAIGLAFKLIGDVNFLSVIALAIALPLVAMAFEKIAKMKDLKPAGMKNLVLVSVAMAIAITLSSYILSMVMPVGIFKLFTAIMIAGMFAVVSYGIGKFLIGLKKANIDPVKDWKMLAALPLVMVAISVAIALSSYALQLVMPVGIFKLFTAIFIAAMFGAVAFGIGSLLVGLKKAKIDPVKDWKMLAALPIVLVGISLAIALSSLALQLVMPVGIFKLFTAIFIAAMFGAVAFGIGSLLVGLKKAKIDPVKDWKMLAALPIVLVGISLAIALSSVPLSMIQPIGLFQFFTAVMIAIIFIPISFALPFIAKAMKDIDIKRIVLLPIMMVVMAAAIWLSSLILAKVQKIDSGLLFNIIFQAITLAVIGIALGFTMKFLAKIGPEKLFEGGLCIVIIAAAIMVSSLILSLGSYDNYPSLNWSLGVGLSLVGFGVAAFVLGEIAMTGIGALAIAAGCGMILLIAGTVVATAAILNAGNYANYPPVSWSASLALSLGAFGLGALAIGTVIVTTLGIGSLALVAGLEAVLMISQTIVDASAILSKGNFTGGPTIQWAGGIALALGAFTPIYGMMMANSILSLFGGGGVGPKEFSEAIETISDGIVTAATKFNSASVAFQGGPKKEWAEGVGLAIGAFAPVYQVLSENSGWLKSGVSVEDMKNAIMTISQGIVDAANFFGENTASFDISKAPKKEWAEGVGGAIKAFTPALDFISKNTGIFSGGAEIITEALSATTWGIVIAAKNLSKGKFNTQIPEGWMKNVSDNVKTYVDLAKYIVKTDSDDLDIEDVTDGMVELANGYSLLADGVAKLNTQLEQIDLEKLTALKNLTGSIVLLSLMDSDQFEDMMDALEEKAAIFVDVMNDLDKKSPEKVQKGAKSAPTSAVKSGSKTGPPAKSMDDLFRVMQSVDQKLASIAKSNDNLSKYVDEIRSSDIDLKGKK